MKRIYLVIDIGGTKISASAFSSKGSVLGFTRIPSNPADGPEDAIRRLRNKIDGLLADKKYSLNKVRGICVSCPGPFDKKSGLIYRLPNLHSWKGFNLKRRLSKIFRAPVILENDANLAAMGEAHSGAGKGLRNVAYITFSTGIGGGLILDGKIFEGVTGDAFEVGHMTISKGGEKCGCGKRGCLEALASGSAIERKARKLAVANKGSKLYRLWKNSGAMTVSTVIEGTRKSDRLSRMIWNEAIENLAIGISNIIQIMNPDIVVIGGGISKSWNIFKGPLKRHLKKYTWKRPLQGCDVKKAMLGDFSAHYGGYKLLARN
jgi:glucokinase